MHAGEPAVQTIDRIPRRFNVYEKEKKMSDSLSKFMHIWEIESHFRCPVVGAVLSVEKHRTILKKCGYDVKKLKPYEYHQQLMAKLTDQNNVSIKVNNFLRSQAQKHMKRIAGLGEADIRALWDEQKHTGNVGPLMFAIVSHEAAGPELLHDIYGEVHMLAHANMTKVFHVQGELVKTKDLLDREKRLSRQKQDDLKNLGKIRKTEKKRLAELELENRRLKNRLALEQKQTLTEKTFKPVVSRLEERVGELEKEVREQEEGIRIRERDKRRLQIELFSAKDENRILQKEMREMVDNFSSFTLPHEPEKEDAVCLSGNCSKECCAGYQLCAKRVFMVGGITKMKPFYKDLVEKAGGKFDYHDGYLKNAATNLEARVKRSDIVICPVNCNSHNACLKVKKLCHRHNKDLKILSSSSLSAVTNALFNKEHETILN